MADPLVADATRGVDSTASTEASARAVEAFMAATSEMRGCAILGPGGVLASSGDNSLWAEAARALLEAADRAAGNRATHAHVATEEGEAFATRSGDLAMVAVASRFALASLVLADMRAALREARASEPPASAKAEAA